MSKTEIAEIITEEATKEFPEMSSPSEHIISDEDVNRIAEAVVEKAAEDVGVRDIMIGSVMGKGAIPLYGRETRKESCACCLIDPEGPNAPENRMCTTKGAIGTLSDREERDWCSEIKIVSDGRCARARSIREAARVCKEKYPEDTAKFFECYAPAFSKITKGSSNPSLISEDPRKEKYIRELIRTEITLGLLEADLTQMSKRAKELAKMTWDELLEYSPSKRGGSNPGASEDSVIYDIPFAQRLQTEMMKEMRLPFRELLTPGKFPKRDEALKKLGKFTIAEVHDDGDLTVRSADKLYVVTTDGKTFEQKPATGGSNPGKPYPKMAIPEPYDHRVRAELRKIPTLRLKQAYEALGAGKATGIEVVEADRAYALSAIREILWERGQLPPEETELAADMILEGKV